MSDTRLAPRHLGYGLYWMWTLLCFQSTVAFMPFGGGLESVLSSHGEFFGFSLVATVLAHPLWALVFAAHPKFCDRAPWVSATVTALSIATLMVVPAGMPLGLTTLGIVSGISSAMLDVQWMQALGSLEANRSGRAICASICAALLGYQLLVLLGQVSPVLSVAVIVALPLMSAAALAACYRQKEGALTPEQVRRARHDARHIAGALVWPITGSLAFFFVSGCVQEIAMARADFNFLHAVMLAFELVAVALLYLALRCNKSFEVNKIYALVMALVSAGFLALPIVINSGTQAGLTAAVVLINVGTMVIDVVVMCAIAHAAFDWQTSGAIVGGLARGITVGMIMAGHTAGGFLAESIWSGSVDIVVFIVSVTYLLILCCSLYLSHMRGVREDDPQHLADTTERMQDQTVEPVDDSAGQYGADGMQLQANEAAGSPFAQRIEALAFEYHLSRREADVFGLIARGRSIPYVAGALAISENTVRSHVRRIYDKFGVHSKQELLDLVEGLG